MFDISSHNSPVNLKSYSLDPPQFMGVLLYWIMDLLQDGESW